MSMEAGQTGMGKAMQVFRRMDINGDGTVSPEELAECLRKLDPDYWYEHRVDGLFRLLDVNNDHRISFDELEQWLEYGYDKRYGAFFWKGKWDAQYVQRAATVLTEGISADTSKSDVHAAPASTGSATKECESHAPAAPVSTEPARKEGSKSLVEVLFGSTFCRNKGYDDNGYLTIKIDGDSFEVWWVYYTGDRGPQARKFSGTQKLSELEEAKDGPFEIECRSAMFEGELVEGRCAALTFLEREWTLGDIKSIGSGAFDLPMV